MKRRFAVLVALALTACEWPIAPWGMAVTCDGRDTLRVAIETEWMRRNIGRCSWSSCAIGDTIMIVTYTNCHVRISPEGRPVDHPRWKGW